MSATHPDTLGSSEPGLIDMIAIHRAARRADRLRQLGDVRKYGVYLAEQLTDYVACRLPYDQDAILKKIEDPTLAYCRVARNVRQTVALEERLDNEDEARLAGTPLPVANVPGRKPAGQSQNDQQQAIREAVSDLHAASRPEIEPEERERLLDDLFDDYEETETFSGDPIVAAARLCLRLDIVPVDWDEEDEAAPDRVAHLLARWIDTARTHYERRANRKPSAQGPPTTH